MAKPQDRSSVQVAHDLFEEYTDSDLKEVQVSQSHVDFGLKTVGSSVKDSRSPIRHEPK